MLVLLFVPLWFILRGNWFCYALCYFVLVFFSLFSIAINSLGKVRANLSAFLMFVRFARGLGRAVACDCGTPWIFLLPFDKALHMF